MYSTCLFCHQSLGANESIEHFQVGERLAFDAQKGRLWAICPHCLRWNLTPLEERWEAIDECERLYRGQRLRVQTDQIGMAKLRDGLQLVRIGEPLRPEFAAWRYGDVFRKRFRRMAAITGAGLAAAGAGAAVGVATGALESLLGVLVMCPPLIVWSGPAIVGLVRGYRDYLRVTHVPREQGRPFTVFGTNIKETDLAPGAGDDEWLLNFHHAVGVDTLSGNAARRALGILLTRVNASGALSSDTKAASERIATIGGPSAYLRWLAEESHVRTGDYAKRRARYRRTGNAEGESLYDRGGAPPRNLGALPNLSLAERLALEMAVHEEDERRALAGELAPLEAAWREAEEIATIADNLLTSPEHQEFVRRHRRRA